jgi:hypothetical protein
VIADRDLDARLAGAAAVRDADLPALPEGFLTLLTTGHLIDGEPASVVAARQLVADAHFARTATGPRRRRPGRTTVVRLGTAVVAVAAAWTTAVVVTTPGGTTPPAAPPPTSTTGPATPTEAVVDPPGGLDLVALQQITFPYSLDPAPADLTPVLSRYGGITPFGTEPAVWTAAYRSDDDPGFTFTVSSVDPREGAAGQRPQDDHGDDDVRETGTVPVDGVEAEFTRGDHATPSCHEAPATPRRTEPPADVCSDSFAELSWQRTDGQWVHLWGEGDTYSQVAELASVAGSIVDRPQPVPLQVGLAPAGWSVSGYEDNSALTLVSDADPSISNRISVGLQQRWRGYASPDDVLRELAEGNPVEQVTVNGQPAGLVSVPDPFTGPGFGDQERRMWDLAAQLPDGPVFLLQAPDTLSREDLLAIAGHVAYTP